LKKSILGVRETTLKRHGAVSEQTAGEMADGVRKLTGADIGLAITGIAGPGGSTPAKPVGLVFLHLSSARGGTGARRIFPGNRETIKSLASYYALNLVREHLQSDGQ
jgi:nicotinamide-nucleotide amidase